MNIRDFRSKIESYGGLSRKNLFVVEIYDNGTTSDPNIEPADLRFFCKSATLPGINIAVQDYYPNGFGLKQSIPTTSNHQDLNLVFMLDSDHRVLSFFHKWMQKIVNYDVSGGIFSSVDDQLPYEFGYKNEYATTMNIKHYRTDYNGYYEYVLSDVFPTEVGAIDVSWEDNDSYATVTVNFSYSSIKVPSTLTGIPSERYTRGNGLVEFINSVSYSSQLINQSFLPSGIQDIIDAATVIDNAFDSLNSIF